MKISTVDDYNDGELASGGNEPDYQTASASWNAYVPSELSSLCKSYKCNLCSERNISAFESEHVRRVSGGKRAEKAHITTLNRETSFPASFLLLLVAVKMAKIYWFFPRVCARERPTRARLHAIFVC